MFCLNYTRVSMHVSGVGLPSASFWTLELDLLACTEWTSGPWSYGRHQGQLCSHSPKLSWLGDNVRAWEHSIIESHQTESAVPFLLAMWKMPNSIYIVLA